VSVADDPARKALLTQSTVVLILGYHPRHSVPGITRTAVTAVVMFTMAAGKAQTGGRCVTGTQRLAAPASP
jgi:hypothetical protein